MKRTSKPQLAADAAKAGLSRRTFLTGSTAVAAAAGGGVASLGGALDGGQGSNPADPRRLEYRETDHIRRFYALSRF